MTPRRAVGDAAAPGHLPHRHRADALLFEQLPPRLDQTVLRCLSHDSSLPLVDGVYNMVDAVYMMVFGYSLALVAAGSALHALWNVLVKRSGTSDVAFVWVYSAITAPLWLAVLTVVALSGGLGPSWWASHRV